MVTVHLLKQMAMAPNELSSLHNNGPGVIARWPHGTIDLSVERRGHTIESHGDNEGNRHVDHYCLWYIFLLSSF